MPSGLFVAAIKSGVRILSKASLSPLNTFSRRSFKRADIRSRLMRAILVLKYCSPGVPTPPSMPIDSKSSA